VLLCQLAVPVVKRHATLAGSLGCRSGILVLVDLGKRLGRLLVGELEDSRGKEGFRVEGSSANDVVEVVLASIGSEKGESLGLASPLLLEPVGNNRGKEVDSRPGSSS
jgi:hypothetical protein